MGVAVIVTNIVNPMSAKDAANLLAIGVGGGHDPSAGAADPRRRADCTSHSQAPNDRKLDGHEANQKIDERTTSFR